MMMFLVFELICILVLYVLKVIRDAAQNQSTDPHKQRRKRPRQRLRTFPKTWVLWPTPSTQDAPQTNGGEETGLQDKKCGQLPTFSEVSGERQRKQTPHSRKVPTSTPKRTETCSTTPFSKTASGSRNDCGATSRERDPLSRNVQTSTTMQSFPATPHAKTNPRTSDTTGIPRSNVKPAHLSTLSSSALMRPKNAPAERPLGKAPTEVTVRAPKQSASCIVEDFSWEAWKPKMKVPTKTWFEESKMTEMNIVDRGPLQLNSQLLEWYEDMAVARNPYYGTLETREEELQRLLNKEPHRYKRCKLKLTSVQSASCRVISAKGENSQIIEISGRSKIGQTYNDDEVVVKINSRSAKMDFEPAAPVFGEVVGLLRRHRYRGVDHPVLLCTMDPYESWMMHPVCRTVPKIRVRQDELKRVSNQDKKDHAEIFQLLEDGRPKHKRIFRIPEGRREEYFFMVAVVLWGVTYVYPYGIVLRAMEVGTDYNKGVPVLEFKHDVPRQFPLECVRAVDKLRSSCTSDQRRHDFTERLTFTIDGAKARDLDDALSVWEEEGLYVVGVHIADVTAVVEKGDSVDVEARRRGCTYYPPGGWRPYPMLPEPLSQERCSLLPGETRPTLSLLFRLDDKGEQHGQPELRQAVIRSSRQLTYTETQRIIDRRCEPGKYSKKLVTAVQKLNELARHLRFRRLGNGAHHHRYGDPRLSGREEEEGAREAHALVEEFMVKTNLHIAQRLFAAFPHATLLRSQDAPKADELRKWLEKGGATCYFLMKMQGQTPLQGTPLSVLEYCNETSMSPQSQMQYLSVRRDVWQALRVALCREDLKEVTRLLTVDDFHPKQLLAAERWRALSNPAVYRCSTVPDPERNDDLEPNGHYTLQAKAYCHFTSPIRRYADVVVHRMVNAMLANHRNPAYHEEEVREIAEELTQQDEKPRLFERDFRDRHLATRLSQRPLQVVGVVGGVSIHGLDLFITGMNCPPRSLQDVPFNLLNLCTQPEVRGEARSGEEEVKCKFRRRIYNARLYSARIDRGDGMAFGWIDMTADDKTVQVNEHHLVVSVSSRRWCRLLEAFLSSEKGRLQSMQKQVDRVGPEGEREQRPGSRNNISCESGDGHLATLLVTFERTFAPGQAVHLQLGAGSEKGMLVPRVSLLWVSHNLHLCLDHVRDPVPQLAPQAVKAFRGASNLEEYVSTWLPLLEMEGATEAVQGEGGVILEDVEVKLGQGWAGDFTLHRDFCRERCLDVGGRPVHFITDAATRVGPCTEYLCLRIPLPVTQSHPPSTSEAPSRDTTVRGECDQTKLAGTKAGETKGDPRDPVTTSPTQDVLTDKGQLWIGHGRVVSVCGESVDKVKVTFELREGFMPRPRCLLHAPNVTATVEILPVLETQRRSVAMLEELLAREEKFRQAASQTPPSKPGTKAGAGNEANTQPKEKLAQDLAKAIALLGDFPLLERSRLQLAKEIEKDLIPRPPDLPPNNRSQEKAITESLSSTFSLIHGPPGTGKSYTGVKLVYLFYKINADLQKRRGDKKQILFCGPSNKSVDVAARLAKKHLSKMIPSPKIARMYGKSMEELDFPVPGKKLLRRGGGDRKCDPDLHDVTIHHLIREEGKMYATELKKYDEYFKRNGDKMDALTMRKYLEYTKILFKATTDELSHYDVIFCTCSVAGNRKLLEGTDVFQVMVDECAMCPEPLCMVPVVANKARQVVLIGDHKQLRPIVKNRQAAEMGLATSLFERHHDKASMLETQYRMNPQLCEFPSKCFYEGKLKTGESKSYLVDRPLSLWPEPQCPHVFVHVVGEERMLTVASEEGNTMSRSNAQEARKVVQIVRRMLTHEGVPPSDIYVMSQYNAQCHVIKEKLQIEDIAVNTVVASQGGEWDYVVFSTVRSLTEVQIEDNPTRGWSQRHLGFITDQNQINVALTRARKASSSLATSICWEKTPFGGTYSSTTSNVAHWLEDSTFLVLYRGSLGTAYSASRTSPALPVLVQIIILSLLFLLFSPASLPPFGSIPVFPVPAFPAPPLI